MTRASDIGALFSWMILSTGISIPEGGLVDLVTRFGLPVAGIVFFVLRGDKRESDQVKRIRQLEDRYATALEGVVKDNTLVMKQVLEMLSKE